MSLFKTISGVAKAATGKVGDFRKVLDINPSALSFALPPQVQLGLKTAQSISGVINENFGTSIKIPTENDLKALATGQLDRIMPGLRREVLPVLKTADGIIKTVDDAAGTLSKLDWLL